MSRPSRPIRDTLLVLGLAVLALATLVMIGAGLMVVFPGLVAVYSLLIVVVVYGWAVYAFLRYRHGRQDEMLALLTASVAANIPLAPCVRAYLRERPRGNVRRVWEMLLTFFVFPGYYWLWHRRHRFDYRAEQFAALLEEGVALSDALRAVPAVASREVRLAVAVGETTDRLPECLRRVDRERTTAVWVELGPRLIYPLIVMWFVFTITTFMASVIIPKYIRIFAEFERPNTPPFPLPRVTGWLIEACNFLAEYGYLVGPLVLLCAVAVAALIASPTFRWYLPVFRWIYRSEMQGQVLRLIGAQVEAGRPAPEALWKLAEADEFPPVVRRALRDAGQALDRGESLADALYGAVLLPGGMVPLVRSAEATGTLGWALAELGDHLGTRAVRRVRRLSLFLAPASVVVVGAVVGFVALGMFTPLLALMERVIE
jgi:type IV pilus assembly protein PilC